MSTRRAMPQKLCWVDNPERPPCRTGRPWLGSGVSGGAAKGHLELLAIHETGIGRNETNVAKLIRVDDPDLRCRGYRMVDRGTVVDFDGGNVQREKVVELHIVERASDNTIGRTLKKTFSNRIARRYRVRAGRGHCFVSLID